ncbi:hypothetical protein FPV67DRAFT_1668681 [Lyophyllum atratum]|nr:hypothetical protein FPV67DRAFT_1668681 [Lyophyllum atratum]
MGVVAGLSGLPSNFRFGHAVPQPNANPNVAMLVRPAPGPQANHRGRLSQRLRNSSTLQRVHVALMVLGPWEGRAVAFVLGCGIGVLLRMFWVLAIVSYRLIKGPKEDENKDPSYYRALIEHVRQYALPAVAQDRIKGKGKGREMLFPYEGAVVGPFGAEALEGRGTVDVEVGVDGRRGKQDGQGVGKEAGGDGSSSTPCDSSAGPS